MTLKYILALFSTFLLAFTLVSDKLEGKKYRLIINEKKGEVYSEKSFQHILEFEKGKIYCDEWLYEKFTFKNLEYKITKDTLIVVEEDNVDLFVIDVKGKNDLNEDLKGTITFTDSDCEGIFKIFRKDALKRVFEFSGSEYVGKK